MLIDSSAQNPATVIDALEARIAASAPAEHGAVLVVDDDPVMRTLVQVACKQANLGVTVAVDAATFRTALTALTALSASSPTVVVIDIEVGEVNGLDLDLDLVRETRANAATAATPILVLSGYADATTRTEKVQRAGLYSLSTLRTVAHRPMNAPATPLHALHAAGQSIWLDFIDRTLLASGELARRIPADALTGMTSNPTIFEKALAHGNAYDAQLKSLASDRTPWAIFEAVETEDVRNACDIFRATYDAAKGGDGFVSIEVSPGTAHDTEGTVQEAHRLWSTVARPNVMIKVPGTPAGCAALRRLIADGINVNVTLLFSLGAYANIIEAYLSGLEDRAKAGQPLGPVSSVASFFVSRVDSEIDKRLDAIGTPDALALRGKAAVANARLAYALFREKFSGARWDALAGKDARVQRPLWASTGTKNPAYSDVVYVETLIAPHTVNTFPPATLDAFRDHGKVARTADIDDAGSQQVIDQLAKLGISLDAVTDKLLAEGLDSFQKSFNSLLAGIEEKVSALGRTQPAAR